MYTKSDDSIVLRDHHIGTNFFHNSQTGLLGHMIDVFQNKYMSIVWVSLNIKNMKKSFLKRTIKINDITIMSYICRCFQSKKYNP